MAATSPEQVPSPQGREGRSPSSAGTHCLGTSPVHTAASVWRVGAELFRSSLQPQALCPSLHSQCAQQHSQVCRPALPAALQPKAQISLWHSWKDHSCPFNLLWPPKCSCPPSLNVSFALGYRQLLLFQKPGEDGKPKAQGLRANAVPTPVYQK